MVRRPMAAIALVPALPALADVFSYEADSPPDESGFEIVQIYCDPELWCDDGWFFAHVELCDGDPPPGGQKATYRRSLAEYEGVLHFFIEWRMMTDGDRSELPWGGPSNFDAWSNGGVNYGFSISRDLVKLNRDNSLPIVEVEVADGVPHTYRLEHYGDQLYVWYVDAQIVDQGVPEGLYPAVNPNVNMRAKAAWLSNTTQWDFVRWGQIPVSGSFDFDSNGAVDGFDFYYFAECVERSAAGEPAVPSCAWADGNDDGTVDCTDWDLFHDAWTDTQNDPPPFPPCSIDPIPATSDWGLAVLALLILTMGTLAFRRPRRAQT